MNKDYLEDFCLEEQIERFSNYLISHATIDQMEAFIESSKRVERDYSEFIYKQETELAEAEADQSNDFLAAEES
jgi:hypothetical protein